MGGAARAVGLYGVGTPHDGVQGSSRDKLGNWWWCNMVSAHVSPRQHLLSVPDGEGQQGWSTWTPAQHPWDPLCPKPSTQEEPPAPLGCGIPRHPD